MKYSLRSLMIVVTLVALSLACLVLAAKCVQMGLALYETPKTADEVRREMQRDGRLPNSSAPAPNQPKD
jgi:hypothetical protein